MYVVSIEGIDHAGKTPLVERLGDIHGVAAVHLTDYDNHNLRAAYHLGKFAINWAKYGERRNASRLANSGYVFNFLPYGIERNSKRSFPVLVSARDPIVTFKNHAELNLSPLTYSLIRPVAQRLLEWVFGYPNLIFYLHISSDTSMRRNSGDMQLHENANDLDTLIDLLEKELLRIKTSVSVKNQPVEVITIDAEPPRTIDDITEEVKYHLREKVPELGLM